MSDAGRRAGLSRRHVLELGAVWTGAVLLPSGLRAAGAPAHAHDGGDRSFTSPAAPPFVAELPIPPVAEPVRRDATTDFYELAVRAATTEIIPGLTTPIWGYEGISPGPTIRARKGRRVVATFRNELPPDDDPRNLIVPVPNHGLNHDARPSSTVVHLHGINTTHESDGFPDVTFVPGESFTYDYPNNDYQRAATLWYHDHSIDITGPHIYRGLKGLYLLTDEVEDALPLPEGEFDVPLVIADAVIDPSGVLVYANGGEHSGVVGDVLTVNGVQQPRMEVANRRYRFRILDGADHRQFQLGLSDGTPFDVIGADQGLLAAPEPASALLVAPAERYEIVIDFSRYPLGTRVVLENQLRGAEARNGSERNGPSTRQVMAFDVVRRERDDSTVPTVLRPDPPPIPRAQAVRERTFEFNRRHGVWSINGLQWETDRVDADPALDSTEIWHLVNKSGGWTHPIHIHLVRFRVLAIKGRPFQAGETGWKDMILLGPNVSASVIMEFRNFRGRFVMHCHNASHEDHDMMTQFEVV